VETFDSVLFYLVADRNRGLRSARFRSDRAVPPIDDLEADVLIAPDADGRFVELLAGGPTPCRLAVAKSFVAIWSDPRRTNPPSAKLLVSRDGLDPEAFVELGVQARGRLVVRLDGTEVPVALCVGRNFALSRARPRSSAVEVWPEAVALPERLCRVRPAAAPPFFEADLT